MTLALAVVHHANQHLVTDGYDARDGITAIVRGYAAVLDLHERRRVPLVLHLSGTLVEALAWHAPWFLRRVAALAQDGLVELLGGAYGENVLPLFPAEFNRRQLDEVFPLMSTHLGAAPRQLSGCWVPERVWHPDLAAQLSDPTLPNGGYRYVLLDDRLLLPAGPPYEGSPRSFFDAVGPYPHLGRPADRTPLPALDATRRCYRVADGGDLVVVPICSALRYWVPVRSPAHRRLLDATVDQAAERPEQTLLVYADDLEKAAGVGGWEPALRGYADFLDWLRDRADAVRPVRLDDWLDTCPPTCTAPVGEGTYYELARGFGAGEDYRGWSEDPRWSPYRAVFARAVHAVEQSEPAADGRLLELAWKHLLASAHETAWQDAAPDGVGRHPAPWARAMAAQSAAAVVLAAAARWFAQDCRPAGVRLCDLLGDGEPLVLLRTGELFAVVTPQHGGRLVHLSRRTAEGGVLCVGNPTEHWNFQESPTRYMDVPANHPGAFADVGFEHDTWEVAEIAVQDGRPSVRLVDRTPASALAGGVKELELAADGPVLTVRYDLPPPVEDIATELCLSPDYLALLRTGRTAVSVEGGQGWRGCTVGAVTVSASLRPDEPTSWVPPGPARPGHGLLLRLSATGPRFGVALRCASSGDVTSVPDARVAVPQERRTRTAR